jgi:hypothetical protein
MKARKRKTRRAAAAIGATMLLLSASAVRAKAADLSVLCMDQRKVDAFHVRELQTHLMVAALACDAAIEYNAFIRRYTPALTQHGTELRRYFSATFGPDGGWHLNRFVTDLANRVSQISATQPAEFCSQTVALFGTASPETLAHLLPAAARTVSVDGPGCKVAVR